MKKHFVGLFLLISFVCLSQDYQVESFGAKSDGVNDNTPFIQAAIDSCSNHGGGIVELSKAGIYLSGTIHLKNNVSLEIFPNVTLKAIENSNALKKIQSSILSRMDVVPWKAFICADTQQNIRIFGGGMIDGSGGSACFRDGIENSPERPYGLFLINCTNVVVEDIKLQSSAFWMQRYLNCKAIRLNRLRVFNHVNKNNDGIDIDSSNDVIISDCIIDSSDDGICIKSEGMNPSKNIVISNCIVSSHASAIKLGTGSVGGFENITITNCVIKRSESKVMMHPSGVWGGLTGIELLTTDGGPMKQVIVSNITMEDVENPIHIRLGNRLSGTVARQGYGEKGDQMQGVKADGKGTIINSESILEDIILSNITGKNIGPYPVIVAGYEGHPVRRITLRDITMVYGRPGKKEDELITPNWKANGYPGRGMYGTCLPAYGLVTNFTEDLLIDNFRAMPAPGEHRTVVKHWNRKLNVKHIK